MNQIELKGHIGCINCLIQLSNGNLLTGGDDSSIRIWDINTYNNIMTFEEHFARVTCVIELSNEKIASGSFDTSIRIWNLKEKNCILQLCEHDQWVLCLYILKDKSLVSGGGDNNIIIWNVNKGMSKKILKGHNDLVICISQLNYNDNLISSSDDKTIRIWDIYNGNCLKIFNLSENINFFIFINDNLFIFLSENNLFLKKEFKLDEDENEFMNKAEIIQKDVNLSSNLLCVNDDILIYGNSDGKIFKRSINENKIINEVDNVHEDNINCIILLKDKRYCSCSNDSLIKIWDI